MLAAGGLVTVKAGRICRAIRFSSWSCSRVCLSPSRRAKGAACPAPLAIPWAPDYAALRVRCVARANGGGGEVVIKLGSSSLRHPMTLFPVSPALLARVNGTKPGCALHHWSTLQVLIAPTLRVGATVRTLCVRSLRRCDKCVVRLSLCPAKSPRAHAVRQFVSRRSRVGAGCCRCVRPAPGRSSRRCRVSRTAWVRCRAS